MTVYSQYIYENLLYTHKNINKFDKNKDIHSYNLRNKDKLAVPMYRLHKISNSFAGNCIRMYNTLPSNVPGLSINKFKNFIKHKLCQKAYYSIKDFFDDKAAWQ